MFKKEPIRIVCASNDRFVVLLAVLIKSIEKQNKSGRDIIFYLIDDRISKTNKRKLEQSIVSDSIKIHWIPLDRQLLSNIKFPNDFSTYPKNIYSRLLVDKFLPSTVDKVIYLDSDMMFNTCVSDLWEVDLEGNVIGAVQEPNVKIMDCPWSGVKNYKELNIPRDAMYFNSGLLVINMNRWREENVAQRVVECVEKNKIHAGGQPDQYGLNVVLWDKWQNLDSKWNHYSTMDSEHMPHNIHFVIRKPIYTYYNGLESYKKLFYEHLDNTAWKGFKPIGEFKRKLIKINNILEKVF